MKKTNKKIFGLRYLEKGKKAKMGGKNDGGIPPATAPCSSSGHSDASMPYGN